MFGDWERSRVFPALRVKRHVSATTEFFNAKVLGVTYKGLPVCMVADGKSISTEIEVDEIECALGAPTHYYFGSTDECWLLDPDEFAWYRAQSAHAELPGENGPVPAERRWADLDAQTALAGDRHGHSARSTGGGMLTEHIELS